MNDATRPPGRRCRHCGTVATSGSAFCSKCGAAIKAPSGEADELIESVRALFGRELEIERELGRGAMAVVYAAHDAALQRRVAVKVLLPQYAQDEAMAARFLREARTVAALQHPHVVSVYGVRSNSEVSAIVMQFVDGRSLDVLLAETPRLSSAVAGLILAQAAAGLQHAHDRGIIHRDVKPANILVDRDGRAVVSDFGIALRAGATRLTGTGMVVGTMAYMSPEQRSGDEVGPAADQYALGVMAYELFAGRLPFTGAMPQMVAQHLSDPPPPLGAANPELASFVVNAVTRMLEKKPATRFKDLREPERAFRTLAPDAQATTKTLAAMSGSIAPRSLPPDVRAPATRRMSSSTRRIKRRLRAMAVAGAVLAVAVAGVWGVRTYERTTTVRQLVPAPTASLDSVPMNVAPAAGEAKIVGAPAIVTPAAKSTSRPLASPATAATVPATATVQAVVPPMPSSPTSNAAVSLSPVSMPPAPTAPPALLATLAEARAAARQFVTMLNQHRWSELEQLEPFGGDAALRAELVRLTRTAPDFAAGFERVASVPTLTADSFSTDFVLDLEWRGGKRLVLVRLRSVPQGGNWRLAAFGVSTTD